MSEKNARVKEIRTQYGLKDSPEEYENFELPAAREQYKIICRTLVEIFEPGDIIQVFNDERKVIEEKYKSAGYGN